MSALTILHLITDLDTGGAEAMLAKLVTSMDRNRFRSVVVSMMPPGPLAEPIRAAGIPLFSLGMRRGLPDLGALVRLAMIVRRERPDVLQTWLYHADLLGALVRLARPWAKRPALVWNLRCSDMDMSRYSRLSALVIRALARLSTLPAAVVVNSETGRAVHQRLGYQPRRWQVIGNGFDLNRFQPDPSARIALRAELGLSPETLLIGLPARLDPMKDHGTFLTAAAHLTANRPDPTPLRFVLIGRGLTPDNPLITARIAAVGLSERVALLGERRDMPAVLAGLDLVTLTSAFGEGFANVLGEAMACAVPCVATDVGDARTILGECGRIVPPSDATALAGAWKSVLTLGPEQRQALGARSRVRIAELYALPLITEQYQALYQELVE
ncbi:Glycosyltransferase [uncultured Gammaproteobacteria bacterium]